MEKDEPKERRVGFYAWVRQGFGVIDLSEDAYEELQRTQAEKELKRFKDLNAAPSGTETISGFIPKFKGM